MVLLPHHSLVLLVCYRELIIKGGNSLDDQRIGSRHSHSREHRIFLEGLADGRQSNELKKTVVIIETRRVALAEPCFYSRESFSNHVLNRCGVGMAQYFPKLFKWHTVRHCERRKISVVVLIFFLLSDEFVFSLRRVRVILWKQR